MTQKQKVLIDLILKSEGNYVNDPLDSGGETYKGISRKNFPNWKGWEYIDTIPNKKRGDEFDNEEVNNSVYSFYLINFYNKLKIDDIKDLHISAHLLDQSVNSGNSVGVKCLQRAVNTLIPVPLTVDGAIGPNTIQEANNCNPKTLLSALEEERRKFYRSIVERKPSQEKFLKGWLNRVNNTTKYIDEILK